MHGNSSASTETKPALFGQKPFVVKAKWTEGEWSDSCVSLAVGAGHPKCLPELLFGAWKKALDIPKALHSAANKLILQVAVPEYLELMGRNETVEEIWVDLTHP